MILAQEAVPRDIGLFEWLFSASTWTGPDGVLASAWDTIQLCAAVAAAPIASVP